MKFCVFGIGAVGSILGARLANAFDDVSLVERGPQLAAIRADGLRLITPEGDTLCVRPPATDDPRDPSMVRGDVVGGCNLAVHLRALVVCQRAHERARLDWHLPRNGHLPSLVPRAHPRIYSLAVVGHLRRHPCRMR